MTNQLNLLPTDESARRLNRLASLLNAEGIDVALISNNANKFYLTGRVFSGWLTVDRNANLRAFIKRPIDLTGSEVTFVRKHEEIEIDFDCNGGLTVGLEFATLAVADYNRLMKHLGAKCPGFTAVDVTSVIRKARAVKTPYEVEKVAESGRLQTAAYSHIPELYRPGMTDLQFQIEIERALRLEGCLGQFRISGDSMEIFMGNILAGDNADNPTPYDFAMGGRGANPSLPVGADNTRIEGDMSVMVDANGNFTGYMTDMTRTYYVGTLPELAVRAHQCSIDICRELAATSRPGTAASSLYEKAVAMAAEADLADYFMGHRQKAGFIGHGVGIEINEAPVIAPRSRDILEAGNVIALEPKFVIPGTGAVGIENTYVVTPEGMQLLTLAPQELQKL